MATLKKLQLKTIDVSNVLVEMRTGREFYEMTLVTMATSHGLIEILFNKEGELVQQGQDKEIVKQFATFFEKQFQPVLFDNTPCWGAIQIH